ncbi:MAG: hypothetical protein AAF242_20600, partial [Bacteroidota bacterium]
MKNSTYKNSLRILFIPFLALLFIPFSQGQDLFAYNQLLRACPNVDFTDECISMFQVDSTNDGTIDYIEVRLQARSTNADGVSTFVEVTSFYNQADTVGAPDSLEILKSLEGQQQRWFDSNGDGTWEVLGAFSNQDLIAIEFPFNRGGCDILFDGVPFGGQGGIGIFSMEFLYSPFGCTAIVEDTMYTADTLSNGMPYIVSKSFPEEVDGNIANVTLINVDSSTENTFATVSYERKEIMTTCIEFCEFAEDMVVTNQRQGTNFLNFLNGRRAVVIGGRPNLGPGSSLMSCDGPEEWFVVTVPESGGFTFETFSQFNNFATGNADLRSTDLLYDLAVSVFSECGGAAIVDCQNLDNGQDPSVGDEVVRVDGLTPGSQAYIAVSLVAESTEQLFFGGVLVGAYDPTGLEIESQNRLRFGDPCSCDDPLNYD